jgi:Rps23 Pro-64 3,4-dihydroxylase Tpa1-like proline 4-hydroxylase
MGPASRAVIAALQAPAFVDVLETLTGVDRLLPDPELDGGGIQQTLPGGFLNVHTDFLSHAKRRHWSRQINLLLFLNRDWPPAYRGTLEFWDADVRRCVRRIEPVFNRCVIFRTGRTSFHGVPSGVACPAGRSRKSLALYYFREEERTCRLTPTRYVPLPQDPPLRRALIGADRLLLHVYSVLKRYTPLTDRAVSRLLKHI